MLEKVIGVILIIAGISWFWYCFRKVEDSSFNKYSIPRDIFTGIFILLLGILILLGVIAL